jgi:NAD(P)-dependent dehydrogenase (short-subunit alcohol dehydrogenase family)
MEWYSYILIALMAYLLRRFLNGPFSKHRRNMKGKVIIITGSSAGLGKESALQLLNDGADVVFATRDKSKTFQILDTLSKENRERAHWIHLDLCSLKSVDSFVEGFRAIFSKVDILMNNAGGLPSEYCITDDNIDSWMQANHISHMYLTYLLIDNFDKEEGRIINVSSVTHKIADFTENSVEKIMGDEGHVRTYYNSFLRKHVWYGNTKLANIYLTSYLAEVLEKKYPHIKTFSLHPGVVNTEFTRYFSESTILRLSFKLLYPLIYYGTKTSLAGAQTQLDLCYRDLKELENGGYFLDCRLAATSNLGKNNKVRDLVIEHSYNLLKRSGRHINFVK